MKTNDDLYKYKILCSLNKVILMKNQDTVVKLITLHVPGYSLFSEYFKAVILKLWIIITITP